MFLEDIRIRFGWGDYRKRLVHVKLIIANFKFDSIDQDKCFWLLLSAHYLLQSHPNKNKQDNNAPQ